MGPSAAWFYEDHPLPPPKQQQQQQPPVLPVLLIFVLFLCLHLLLLQLFVIVSIGVLFPKRKGFFWVVNIAVQSGRNTCVATMNFGASVAI